MKRRKVYVRFVCFQTVSGQRQRLGLFQAIDEARRSDYSEAWALKEIGALYDWFKRNLSVPKQFTRDPRRPSQPCLSWFKPIATEHIQQMHRLKLALEACGVHVEVLTTDDPGEVVWQDEHQIVAEPGGRKF